MNTQQTVQQKSRLFVQSNTRKRGVQLNNARNTARETAHKRAPLYSWKIKNNDEKKIQNGNDAELVRKISEIDISSIQSQITVPRNATSELSSGRTRSIFTGFDDFDHKHDDQTFQFNEFKPSVPNLSSNSAINSQILRLQEFNKKKNAVNNLVQNTSGDEILARKLAEEEEQYRYEEETRIFRRQTIVLDEQARIRDEQARIREEEARIAADRIFAERLAWEDNQNDSRKNQIAMDYELAKQI